ncbi:MAG: hypothetical protein IPJ19_20130 [Planctomycetes bacterium]|nr:hypothetical protein [Planctomycetota bacterium]
MGAHLDYNGGPVMPTAIDRGTFFALRPRSDHRVRFASTLEPGEFEAALADLPGQPARRWWDYPVGVLRELLAGTELPDVAGFDLLFGATCRSEPGSRPRPRSASGRRSRSRTPGSSGSSGSRWCRRHSRPNAAMSACSAGLGACSVGLARSGALLWLDCKDRSSAWMPLDDRSVCHRGGRHAGAAGARTGAFQRARAAKRCAPETFAGSPHQPGAHLRDIRLATLRGPQRATRSAARQPRRARRARGQAHFRRARRAGARETSLPSGEQMTRARQPARGALRGQRHQLDTLVDSATACAGDALGSRPTSAGFTAAAWSCSCGAGRRTNCASSFDAIFICALAGRRWWVLRGRRGTARVRPETAPYFRKGCRSRLPGPVEEQRARSTRLATSRLARLLQIQRQVRLVPER